MTSILEQPAGAESKERRRLMLLADVGSLAAGDLDERALLQALAAMAVGEVGEWCEIDALNHGVLERVALETALESRRNVREYFLQYPPRLDLPSPLKLAIETRETQRISAVDEEMIDRFAADESHAAAIKALGIASGAIVPMVARGECLGAMTIASSADFPPLDQDDLGFLEELARRGAQALDRSRLFRQLSSAEARFRSVLDHIGAVVWEYDPQEDAMRFVGSSVEALLGIEATDLCGVAQAVLPPKEQRSALWERLRRNGSADFEREADHLSGRSLWCTTQLVLDRDETGNEVVRGVTVDSTERHLRERQIDAELQIARVLASASTPEEIPERVMRAMLDALGWDAAGLWMPDGDELVCGTFVARPSDLAPRFREASLATRFTIGEGLPGRVWESGEPIWVEDLASEANFPRAAVAVGDGMRSGVAFVVRSRGEMRFVLEFFCARARPRDQRFMSVLDALGRQVGHIMERRSLDAQLVANENRLRSLVTSALDALVAMDDQGLITDFNPAAERIFGYERGEAIGRKLGDLIVPPSLRAAHEAGLARLVATGSSRIVGRRLELSAMRADGSEFPIELVVTQLSDAPPSFVGFIRDMSEEHALLTRRDAQFAVTRILATAASMGEAVPELLRALGEALGWRVGMAWRPRDHDGLQVDATWQDELGEYSLPEVGMIPNMGTHEGFLGKVYGTQEAIWIEDAQRATGYLRSEAAEHLGVRCGVMFPIVSADRTVAVFEFYGDAARREDPELLRTLVGMGRQIGSFSERTIAIEQMRLHRAILAAQSDASIEGVLVVSASGRILSRNARFDQLFGFGRGGELGEGRDVLEVILGASNGQDGADALKGALVDQHLEVREDLELRDGRVFEVYTVPLRSSPADPPIGRAWFFRDISDRRHTEDLIIEASRRSAFLAELGTVLIKTMDRETILLEAGRSALAVLGDRCVIDLVDERGGLRRLAILERGPGGVTTRSDDAGVLHPEVDSVLARAMESKQVQIEHAPDPGGGSFPWRPMPAALLCVPLTARGRFLGAITFGCTRDIQPSDAAVGVARDLGERVSLAIDRASLYLDRSRVAATLQDSLLPPNLPEIPGMRLAARYLPARAEVDVGGDFYDVFEAGRRDWVFVIGDVCGKGAEAAAVTALARHTIRATVLRTRRPRMVLGRVNEALLRHTGQERFATIAYLRARLVEGGGWRLNIGLGGHPSPWVIREDGRVERLGQGGTLLGALTKVHIADVEDRLAPGDTVIMLTDGVLEARNVEGEQFGDDRVTELLQRMSGEAPDVVAARIVEAARDFQEGLLRDDIAILAFQSIPENGGTPAG